MAPVLVLGIAGALIMSNLHNYHQGQLVTFENSTVIMVIAGFEQENGGNWEATVYFKSDPRKTTMNFPVSMLCPAIDNSSTPTVH
jgi:hypothetical protein